MSAAAVTETPATTIPAPATPASISPVNTEAARKAAIERAQIDASVRGPVLTFFFTAVTWLAAATFFGFLQVYKLSNPEFLAGVPWLTYGRIVPAYNATFLYGWASLAGMGVAIWLMARLCRVPAK